MSDMRKQKTKPIVIVAALFVIATTAIVSYGIFAGGSLHISKDADDWLAICS